MSLYVHLCMDANTITSYVIKLHFMVWVSCYYAIMWLCYHYAMMSCGLALSRMIIVNIIMRCDIKPHYVECSRVVMMFFLFLLRRSFIENTTSSYVINLHEQYVSFQ